MFFSLDVAAQSESGGKVGRQVAHVLANQLVDDSFGVQQQTMWVFLFYGLVAECALLYLLLLGPTRTPMYSLFKHVPLSYRTLRPYMLTVGALVVLLFGAAMRSMWWAAQQLDSLDPNAASYRDTSQELRMRKWLAERNSYLSFFCMYLYGAIVLAFNRAGEKREEEKKATEEIATAETTTTQPKEAEKSTEEHTGKETKFMEGAKNIILGVVEGAKESMGVGAEGLPAPGEYDVGAGLVPGKGGSTVMDEQKAMAMKKEE